MELLVRIVTDWGYPRELDFMQQTPGAQGVWDGVCFTDEETDESDFLIVFKNPKNLIETSCRYAWLISHEPPIKRNKYFINSFKNFDKVFSYYRG